MPRTEVEGEPEARLQQQSDREMQEWPHAQPGGQRVPLASRGGGAPRLTSKRACE